MYIREAPSNEQMQQLRRIADEHNEEEHLDYDQPALTLAWTLVHRYRLVLRPSLLGSRWICGRLKSVMADGKVVCVSETTIDAPTAELAVYWAALKTIEVEGE
jgi:hypothetical protein